MNTNKPTLSQVLATAQLAEMAYNADQSEYKKAAWEKALGEYVQAATEQAALEQAEPEGDQVTLNINTTNFIQELGRLEEETRQLAYQKHTLEHENTFLKNQLIEKEAKISELEKLALSANPATPAVAPVAAPVVAPEAPKPLTGAAKAAVERAAAKAAEAAAAAEEEAKKNS